MAVPWYEACGGSWKPKSLAVGRPLTKRQRLDGGCPVCKQENRKEERASSKE